MTDGLYIGKAFNPADKSLGERFLLDPSDLATHGIIIGMTGSGKTGFAVDIIEEALRARIPVVVIDPKGDLGNLAFAFDRLAPEQFQPWVDRDEATREGKTVEQVAADTAASWTKGLADWGVAATDVAAYAGGHRCRILTPGSTAGISINLIDSLAAPGVDFDANEEELHDEIDSIVTALLGFVKIEADPVSSREYILLFSLIESAWRKGQDLSLEALIAQVANPPIEKVGALTVDAFYPQADRNKLMYALNNLVASPPFQVWRRGIAIDFEEWVRPKDGVAPLTIVYTAHLEDDQRLMVTALILNKLKSWMRRQPGTSELRCLFYMDEIFGYFPPTANPPTKKPLLTLLKQARAYGVGVLLATQNPVDLDYKGLSNMGFWAVGRLQTKQDQDRIRDGIEAALSDAAPGTTFDSLMAAVQKRVFLVHDIHREKPELVQSRWAMSYLRGPLTLDEIRTLTPEADRAANGAAAASSSAGAATATATPVATSTPAAVAPVLPAPLKGRYAAMRGGNMANPYLFVKAAVRYKVAGATTEESTHQLAFPLGAAATAVEVLEATPLEVDDSSFVDQAPDGIAFADLPGFLQTDGAKGLERALKDRLDDKLALSLAYDPVTKAVSLPGEDDQTFATRIGSTGVNAQRQALEAKLTKARTDLATKQADASGRKREKWFSIASAVISNIGLATGRKRSVTGVTGVLSKNRMEGNAEMKVDQLEALVTALQAQLDQLANVDPSRFERKVVKPAKTDVAIVRYDILWVY